MPRSDESYIPDTPPRQRTPHRRRTVHDLPPSRHYILRQQLESGGNRSSRGRSAPSSQELDGHYVLRILFGRLWFAELGIGERARCRGTARRRTSRSDRKPPQGYMFTAKSSSRSSRSYLCIIRHDAFHCILHLRISMDRTYFALSNPWTFLACTHFRRTHVIFYPAR